MWTILLFKKYYSFLNATIGSRLAAFFAGYIPKNKPTNVENPIAKIIENIEIEKLQLRP